MVVNCPSENPLASDQSKDDQHNCDHKKNVDEAAAKGDDESTEEPEKNENDDNDPKKFHEVASLTTCSGL